MSLGNITDLGPTLESHRVYEHIKVSEKSYSKEIRVALLTQCFPNPFDCVTATAL